MNPIKLKYILKQHKLWLTSNGIKGNRADLSEANLNRADLYGADLYEADLSYANLYGADLSEADLYEANLSYANLSEADLSYANLYGADLNGANLIGVKGLNEAHIEKERKHLLTMLQHPWYPRKVIKRLIY